MHRGPATQIVKVNNAAFPPRGRSPTTAQLHSKVGREIGKTTRAFLAISSFATTFICTLLSSLKVRFKSPVYLFKS